MRFARLLVELERSLRDAEVLDLFAPDAGAALQENAETAQLRARLPATLSSDQFLKVALQALRIQHSHLAPKLLDATFVATLPGTRPTGASPTRHVVAEMLRPPAHEVIALGYEISHRDVLDGLHELARSGTAITLICDRGQVPVDAIREAWPSSCQPRIFTDQFNDGGDHAKYAKMHCKALLVDDEDLLITSANFTFHGLEGNIEFGVRLRGAPAADARKVFDHMLSSGLLVEA